MEFNNCKNCNEPLSWDYCPKCGRPATLKRIDGKYILNEIGDFLFANKGLIYTVINVLISPGASIRYFIKEDRYRFVKPITFVIITSLIYTIINYFFPIEVDDNTFKNTFISINIGNAEQGTKMVFRWMRENLAYTNLMTVMFAAFALKLFFRKSGYNLFEIFTLVCFVSGILTLFITIGKILQGLTQWNLLDILEISGLFYITWAIGQFFNKKKVVSYIKAFFAYLLGMIIFGSLMASVGSLFDLFI
jgi:hypothetical protein